MDFIFDDEDRTVVRLMGNQIVRGLKLNVVATVLELSREVSPPLDNTWPTRKLAADLINNVVKTMSKK